MLLISYAIKHFSHVIPQRFSVSERDRVRDRIYDPTEGFVRD